MFKLFKNNKRSVAMRLHAEALKAAYRKYEMEYHTLSQALNDAASKAAFMIDVTYSRNDENELLVQAMHSMFVNEGFVVKSRYTNYNKEIILSIRFSFI